MKSMNLISMPQHRDGIAMPICGDLRAAGWSGAPAASVAAARVRLVKGTEVKGHVGTFATGDVAYVPGTRVWSPPPC